MSTTHAAEMTIAVDNAGTLRTLYVSTGPLVTSPTDTPAHIAFEARIQQPANFRQDLFSPGTTAGASKVAFGELVLANPDGELDGWIQYGWSGRPIVLRIGEPGAAYPAQWVTVLRGTMEQAVFEGNKVIIRIRDRQAELDVPASANTYAGSNILPNGLEGEEDLQDQHKPRAWGTVRNVAPPCCNTARLIYQVNDGAVQSVPAVYDKGAALTLGVPYASQADMEANAPAAGTFRVWPAGGCVRLGSSPVGQVTADVVASTAAASRAGTLLQVLARAAGIAAGDISSADVAALDAAAPYTLGLWLPAGADTTCRAAMEQIAAGVGAWYAFDSQGILRMGQLTDPAGDVPVLDIADHEVLSLARAPLRDAGAGVPAWRVTANYARNWTIQPTDLAGAVTPARRTWLGAASRPARAAAATVKNKHLLATDMVLDTLIDARADAQTEAARQLALYKITRDRLEVRIAATPSALAALLPGRAVRVTALRYGLSAGKLLRIIGVQLDLARRRADLTLWG